MHILNSREVDGIKVFILVFVFDIFSFIEDLTTKISFSFPSEFKQYQSEMLT